MTNLEPRLNAFRVDLADSRLLGQVDAEHFTTGTEKTIIGDVVPLFKLPHESSSRQNELLFGEPVVVFEAKDGWAWVQSQIDGYVGYVEASKIGAKPSAPTHWISSAGSWIFEQPDMKTTPVMRLSMGSRVILGETIETRGTEYCQLATGEGYIVLQTVAVPIALADGQTGRTAEEFIRIAKLFMAAPYLWAGRSSVGLDCSALVQLSLMMLGIAAPRDTDMQQRTLGQSVADHNNFQALESGDLIFWPGHVGIMMDADRMIHANGHSMSVIIEPVRGAIDRIAYMYQQPSDVRRLGWR